MPASVAHAPSTTPDSHADTRPARDVAIAAARHTPTHTSAYTANAPALRTQATKLKNRLLTGGTPCQCTSAGACQNASDTGRYSTEVQSSVDSSAWTNSGICASSTASLPATSGTSTMKCTTSEISTIATAYSTPRTSIARTRSRLARKPVNSKCGIGKALVCATLVAAIRPSVPAGTIAIASSGPISGTISMATAIVLDMNT